MGVEDADRRESGTKDRLLRAGERLFAEDGIHRATVRQLNELAGQRNSSALHYHFGSREGLVAAILGDHQARVDDELAERLDELEAAGGAPSIRALVEAVARPLARQLETQSGRDFLRIVPQVLPGVSRSLRSGTVEPITEQTRRLLGLLDAAMGALPAPVRRERLVAYAVVLTGILADRALQLESGGEMVLTDDQFAAHLVDVVTAALDGPTSVEA